jgi:hypothetical protein
VSARRRTCNGPNCEVAIVRLWHKGTNRPAPIEADPHPDGTIALIPGDRYVILTGDALEGARGLGEPLHRNHFATCVDRDRFKAPPGGAR